ncbi:MAG: hypothetical protein EZS28_015233 [Streblomastix strix]|uniref:Uncharacterized protein n=1 Tax=Streblomastix strix TaxID=222440 RepID=A0A5J4W2T3_9EUKA|nr:MAG: hypothetical protein EZS28_015233 [Streblomastix strix]
MDLYQSALNKLRCTTRAPKQNKYIQVVKTLLDPRTPIQLDSKTFNEFMQDSMPVQIEGYEQQSIFKKLQQKGFIDPNVLINELNIPMNQFRKTLTEQIYKKLTQEKLITTLNEFHQQYKAEQSVFVKSGKIPQHQMERTFISTFCPPLVGVEAEGLVTLTEFIFYHTIISTTITDDDFYQMEVWGIWDVAAIKTQRLGSGLSPGSEGNGSGNTRVMNADNVTEDISQKLTNILQRKKLPGIFAVIHTLTIHATDRAKQQTQQSSSSSSQYYNLPPGSLPISKLQAALTEARIGVSKSEVDSLFRVLGGYIVKPGLQAHVFVWDVIRLFRPKFAANSARIEQLAYQTLLMRTSIQYIRQSYNPAESDIMADLLDTFTAENLFLLEDRLYPVVVQKLDSQENQVITPMNTSLQDHIVGFQEFAEYFSYLSMITMVLLRQMFGGKAYYREEKG